MMGKFSGLVWCSQVIFGWFVGFVLSGVLMVRMGGWRGGLNSRPAVFALAMGIGFVVAGLAGKYGDRLWLGRGSLERPVGLNVTTAIIANYVVMGVGCLLVVVAVALFVMQ